MPKQINVVGAVLVRDGKILAAQRSQAMSLPGLWEFPGGKIEPGETPEQALAREMKEELLCDVTVGEHVETTAYEYDFGVVTLTTFYTQLVNGDPQLTEHSAIKWLAPAELRDVEWAPADVPAVDKLVRTASL
ncbi:(deoxy)nucleoside triphosphate pyrophosphohydrolase [Galactobacter sp.]|uniref:(deoxy)nucleoside triphosphate pyrophosphohydrolase n=1 Tax=Galactobacter sp. TaxID=2676125 RepID=UPI0025B7C87C|nr:(deoxy)nucleoside triphosphate pyrophosphohydrolase [Galactobacter sp.]